MNEFQKNLFSKIQESTNVDTDEVLSIADAVQYADFSDEDTVRNLVRQLGDIANRPVSAEKEDRIVHAIVNNQNSGDFESLRRMFNQS